MDVGTRPRVGAARARLVGRRSAYTSPHRRAGTMESSRFPAPETPQPSPEFPVCPPPPILEALL